MNKVVNPGRTADGQVFLKIETEQKDKGLCLSISGVVGPMRNGDCRGSAGQCVDALDELTELNDGWDKYIVEHLQNIWKAHHLNDLTAGSPSQERYLKAHPVTAVYPESHYDKACKVLTKAGLQPDPDFKNPRTGDAYRYGSAWLFRSVPDEALKFLEKLPDTEVTPAWI